MRCEAVPWDGLGRAPALRRMGLAVSRSWGFSQHVSLARWEPGGKGQLWWLRRGTALFPHVKQCFGHHQV